MIRRALSGAAVAVALVVALAGPAAAQYLPNVVVPGTAVAGSEVDVTGSGCAPFQTIDITVYPESDAALAGNPTTAPIITVTTTADADGNYRVTIPIPEGLAPGWYDVLGPCPARDNSEVSTDRAVKAPQLYLIGRFLIVAPSTPTQPGGTGTELPRTGSDLNGLGLVGAGLLVAGGMVLVATKSRRRGTAAI